MMDDEKTGVPCLDGASRGYLSTNNGAESARTGADLLSAIAEYRRYLAEMAPGGDAVQDPAASDGNGTRDDDDIAATDLASTTESQTNAVAENRPMSAPLSTTITSPDWSPGDDDRFLPEADPTRPDPAPAPGMAHNARPDGTGSSVRVASSDDTPHPLRAAAILVICCATLVCLIALFEQSIRPTSSQNPLAEATVVQHTSLTTKDAIGQAASASGVSEIGSTSTPQPSVTAVASTPTATTTPPARRQSPIAVAPVLVHPEQGHSYKNPIVFEWEGQLGPGQSYMVRGASSRTGTSIVSPPLQDRAWATDIRGEDFGEWHWQVALLQGDREAAVSQDCLIWFTPLDPSVPSSCPLGSRGDVNCDGEINTGDLTVCYVEMKCDPAVQECSTRCDLNGDGVVNVDDITIWYENYKGSL